MMSNYIRGRKAEYRTADILKKKYKCVYVTRSAGSHTLFDVIGFDGNKIYFIQVKRSKKETDFTKEIMKLEKFYESFVENKVFVKIGLFVFIDRKPHKEIWISVGDA